MSILHCNGFKDTMIDVSWESIINPAIEKLDPAYIDYLQHDCLWLPGKDKVFNAFSLPVSNIRYILFGESPYPRPQSANGYAFWDAAVGQIWSDTGLATAVNRATSLRNFIKMLLVANGDLKPSDLTQPTIAQLDKRGYIHTLEELFQRLIKEGFLLLNTSLVLSDSPVKKDAKAWQPFMETLLEKLYHQSPDTKLILLGKIAKTIDAFSISQDFSQFHAEHPYNQSFIINPHVLDFFRPFHLLEKA